MLTSVTLDESLTIIDFNENFSSRILPAKIARGCSILSLFDRSDHENVRDLFNQCVSRPGNFHTIENKIINTISDHPTGFPVRLSYDCVVTYSMEIFNMVLNPVNVDVAKAEVDELKDFFNRAPIALHWLSDEGKVLWANDRELEVLGYTREEYIGEDIMNFCPDSKDEVLEIFKELGSGNTIRDVPIRFRTKDGGIRDLLIDSNVNYKDDGSFNHTRCFIRDDTGRKVREARAEVLIKETKKNAEDKARFIAKIMHEIKTPIHVLSMAASQEGDKHIEQKQISLLTRLVSNITTAMQFDEGYKPIINLVECDIVFFFENYTIPTLENNAVAKFIEPNLKDYVCEVDTKKLTMIVDELLIFCDALNQCEDLHLKVYFNSSNECTIEVSYKGVLLDVPSVHRVFHRYWLDSTASDYQQLKTDTPGLNLGLNIAFNLVECLGSDLFVESTMEKTCFLFALKNKVPVMIKAETSMSISPVKKQLGLYCSSSKHILVVEDNKICQKMLERILKKLGHTYQTADNGAIAVDIVTSTDSILYDLIFMDIRMPVMDGIEATEKITQHLNLKHLHVPIVALTAECNTNTLHEKGFVDVLTKPTSVSDIKASIELYVNKI